MRRSTRNLGKVVDYNKQEKLVHAQVKEAARLDKRKYYSDWRKKEKAFLQYIRDYDKPEPEPEPEPETEPETEYVPPKRSWKDHYSSIEELKDELVKLSSISDRHAEVVDVFLAQKTEICLTYLAYYAKLHSLMMK